MRKPLDGNAGFKNVLGGLIIAGSVAFSVPSFGQVSGDGRIGPVAASRIRVFGTVTLYDARGAVDLRTSLRLVDADNRPVPLMECRVLDTLVPELRPGEHGNMVRPSPLTTGVINLSVKEPAGSTRRPLVMTVTGRGTLSDRLAVTGPVDGARIRLATTPVIPVMWNGGNAANTFLVSIHEAKGEVTGVRVFYQETTMRRLNVDRAVFRPGMTYHLTISNIVGPFTLDGALPDSSVRVNVFIHTRFLTD